MKLIELIPLSEEADAIIEQHGEIWRVERQTFGMPFPGAIRANWLFVKPYLSTQVTKSTAKWINLDGDENFEVGGYGTEKDSMRSHTK
jgi:hypothetical protein